MLCALKEDLCESRKKDRLVNLEGRIVGDGVLTSKMEEAPKGPCIDILYDPACTCKVVETVLQ
jgi:hypothetical protein